LTLVPFEGPSRAGVSLPSPEDRNESNLQSVLFYNYLEFRSMDKVQKSGDSGISNIFALSTGTFLDYIDYCKILTMVHGTKPVFWLFLHAYVLGNYLSVVSAK
jgi:hypothetical protein